MTVELTRQKVRLALGAFMLVCAVSAHAGQDNDTLLYGIIKSDATAGTTYQAQLEKDGYVRTEDGSWTLTPTTTLSRAATKTWEQPEQPLYIAESLYMVKKSTLVEHSLNPAHCDTSLQAVSRVIRSVSKMQGMKYYSNSDKKWAVLYDEAHLVDAANYKQRIADQTDGSADGKQLYCMLKDHTFGKGVYRLDYRENATAADGDNMEVSVCFTNETPLKVLGITGVKPHFMKINLVVIEQTDDDAEDYYYIYMVLQARYPQMALVEHILRRSFYARLDAIYNWFICQF